jgi:DNA-binding response OmpR family regulator
MGKTIVVADDEPDILKCVTFRLSKRGYEVLACGDGLSALELVKNRKPDLVILDVKMPLLNGTEACKRIKQDAALQAIPVILITANSWERMPEKLREVQADDCLLKPFDPGELLERVDRCMGVDQG